MIAMRRSDGNRSEPLPLIPVMAQPIPESPGEEPESEAETVIAVAALHVGPLLPGSKENLYSTVNRKKCLSEEKNQCVVQNETPTETNVETSVEQKANEKNDTHTIFQPKSIMKRPFTRQNSGDGQSSLRNAATTSKIPILSRLSASANSNSSNSSSSNNSSNNSGSKSSSCPSTDDSAKDLIAEINCSGTSITSSPETCSNADTIKQIF